MADGDGVGGGTGLGSPSEKAKEQSFADAVKSAAASGGGGKKSASSQDPLVFLGYSNKTLPEHFNVGSTDPKYYERLLGAKTATLSQVAGQYYNWDQKTRDKFLSQLNLAGYDTNRMKDSDIASMWAGYAQQAAAYYAAGKSLTPWDILSKDMQQREAYMNTPRSVTQTSTSYDMSTREDAHAIFLQAAQSLLGRDPTKSEIGAFQKALNAYEKAHPTVTTQTTNYMGDTVTGQTSTTKGGVKEGARQLMAVEDVKQDPEYGAYQAATTYFDAMMQMIGGG
ncbi:hypothetical protein SEA_VORVOLAKOS_10 [Streptomyces phage Vorvolakos]|uniref:Uncharacterized protein n=3 Tax=Flowerpowervirus flowerpower TaxID=2846396 RepID=A0A2U8UNA0_9CAUD|nr:hypothetical protein HWB61_gp10 [Streptomyces phage FlowerPower]QEA11233.1 hypothetical protein SEA_GEOSTIN_10 [Streptomyces phage Geostin]QFP94729.1 hypothetical protein SEA_FABIAN_10 [Streptomyces phage Fabian]QZD97077.1 hypothetical protein SEA_RETRIEVERFEVER_10 [Streptomyces phage RetrieverFever]UOW93244.1 hypothetical protein SEA_VORVOLAKOS_10 [Streptomyces phage Vorvolakos]AWN05112.1 hypothetical protein SEA_FLOWERPOWER_10 [Streptomyces phage FlowerPower]